MFHRLWFKSVYHSKRIAINAQNNVDLALPILEKYKVPATFFLSAIKLTKYPMLWPDYLDLASFYSTVPIFIDDEKFFKKKDQYVNNLRKAKTYLENIVQHPIDILAYADGSYSRKLLDEAQKIGFKEQYAVDYLFPEDQVDKRIYDRLTINPFTSLDHQINTILVGKY